MNDLEEDPEMRQQVLLYKTGENNNGMEMEDSDLPQIGMDELLEEMTDMNIQEYY